MYEVHTHTRYAPCNKLLPGSCSLCSCSCSLCSCSWSMSLSSFEEWWEKLHPLTETQRATKCVFRTLQDKIVFVLLQRLVFHVYEWVGDLCENASQKGYPTTMAPAPLPSHPLLLLLWKISPFLLLMVMFSVTDPNAPFPRLSLLLLLNSTTTMDGDPLKLSPMSPGSVASLLVLAWVDMTFRSPPLILLLLLCALTATTTATTTTTTRWTEDRGRVLVPVSLIRRLHLLRERSSFRSCNSTPKTSRQ